MPATTASSDMRFQKQFNNRNKPFRYERACYLYIKRLTLHFNRQAGERLLYSWHRLNGGSNQGPKSTQAVRVDDRDRIVRTERHVRFKHMSSLTQSAHDFLYFTRPDLDHYIGFHVCSPLLRLF